MKTLSDKIFYACSPPSSNEPFGRHCLDIYDVKKFIKQLKEEIKDNKQCNNCLREKFVDCIVKVIDKLAGEEFK